jgi:hypothetical protein
VPLRYIFALTASCLFIIAGLAGSKYLQRSFVDEFRQSLRETAAAGKLPKELDGVDLDTVTPSGFDVRVTASQMNRKLVGDLLSNLWFIWIPAVFAACFGTAYMMRRSVGR